jgi:hypothetical protein
VKADGVQMHDDYLNEFPFLGVPNAQPAEDDTADAPRESFV